MSRILKPFGKYFLLDLLAQGGMAEIYRARFSAHEGSNRILVIKKIQNDFDQNSDFIKMFRAEIKISMGFHHPHIVQVYDFGEEKEQLYIVMEWIDGKNLRQIMQQHQKSNKKIPLEFIVFIIKQVAEGLHYAHSFFDPLNNKPLHLIHRDISPQNILVSFEGITKIIDFGVAKTTHNPDLTRTGIIKGKPSYLSPEQIMGDTLDARSDIFSLGAVTWELLTGRKLFAAENDIAILRMIEQAEDNIKPPSTINSNIPSFLDELVLKCLQKDKKKRFSHAKELSEALKNILKNHYQNYDDQTLSKQLKSIFEKEMIEEKKILKELHEAAEKKIQSSGPKESLMFSSLKADQNIISIDIKNDIKQEEPPKIPKIKIPSSSENFSSPSIMLDRTNYPKKYTVKHELSTLIKNPSSKKKPLILPFLFSIMIGSLLYSQKDFLTKFFKNEQQIQAIEKKIITELEKNKKPLIPPAENKRNNILLSIEMFPSGGNATIVLNGTTLNPKKPQAFIHPGSFVDLKIMRPGYKPYSLQTNPQSDKNLSDTATEWNLKVNLTPIASGYLYLKTQPNAEVTLSMDDSFMSLSTPIENQQLAAGTYQAEIINSGLNIKKIININIKENEVKKINLNLYK